LLSWVQGYAYINSTPAINANGTECPPQYRYNSGNLYSPSYDTVANMDPIISIGLPNYYTTNTQQPAISPPSTIGLANGKITKQ